MNLNLVGWSRGEGGGPPGIFVIAEFGYSGFASTEPFRGHESPLVREV